MQHGFGTVATQSSRPETLSDSGRGPHAASYVPASAPALPESLELVEHAIAAAIATSAARAPVRKAVRPENTGSLPLFLARPTLA